VIGANAQVLVGGVISIVELANRARSHRRKPDRRVTVLLEARHGDAIREIFQIDPAAPITKEAQYLIGFQSADEIRNRSLAAKQETDRRLRAKGIDRLGGETG